MTSDAGAREHAVASHSRQTLVLIDEMIREALPDRIAALQRRGDVVEVVDYRHLHGEIDRLKRRVQESAIDFVLFSRNDQVFDKVSIGPIIRALGTGYSSFSGIDTAEYLEQTRICLDDYLAGGVDLAPAVASPAGQRMRLDTRQVRTFSLVFDLEQIGGARFGLPRILELLDRHGVTATFFTTNFVRKIYGDVIDIITRQGHEIGLHGLHHEYLTGRPLPRQKAMIAQMVGDFGSNVRIAGANFIGRMDADTVRALIEHRLTYWVLFMEHRYRPFAYRRMPLRPLPLWTPQGTIWIVPISVETNNRPWFSIRNMLDSSARAAEKDDWPHVNVLLHPFRDGTRHHIRDLERMLGHMAARGYEGVPVGEVVSSLRICQPDAFIYYSPDDPYRTSSAAPTRSARSWWHSAAHYQQRIWRLFQELEAREGRPALCLTVPDRGSGYAVYPHLPADAEQLNLIPRDPLGSWHPSQRDEETSGRINTFVPGGDHDRLNAARSMTPRFRADVAGLIPELALRVAYRLTDGRHVF